VERARRRRAGHGTHPADDVRDLPDTPLPIGIAVSGASSCELAGRLADLLIATEPRPELTSAFDGHGGAGKPKAGQLPICYDPDPDPDPDRDRDAAIPRAHDQFRWFGSGWPVNSELPGPAAFAGATQFVRPYVDAGFTEVALIQIGGDHQEPYLEWAEQQLLPALRYEL
jgi:hypothetical protein